MFILAFAALRRGTATNGGWFPPFVRWEVMRMYVTYAELFSFVLVLCAVIILVVALSNRKRKESKKITPSHASPSLTE